jgi:hypothetical protein
MSINDAVENCNGILCAIYPQEKAKFGKGRITFMFNSDSHGKLLRTYNVPKEINTHKSGLGKFLKECNVIVPKEFVGTPNVLSIYLQKLLRGRVFNLTIVDSGVKEYPNNIVKSVPLEH